MCDYYSTGPSVVPVEKCGLLCIVPVKSLGTARALNSIGPALLRDAVNSAGMGTSVSIPLSSAGSGHTHTHVLPSNTHTSGGTRVAADPCSST